MLLLSAAYLFYALTNILFLPPRAALASGAIVFSSFHVRRNLVEHSTQSINFSQLANKCLLEENQLNPLKFISVLLLAFSGFILFGNRRSLGRPQTWLFYNKQHSYLSYHTFRI